MELKQLAETAAGSELGPDKPSAEPRAARREWAQAVETEREPQPLESLTDVSLDCIARLTLELSGLPKAVRSNDGLDAQCGREEPVLTGRERDWWS